MMRTSESTANDECQVQSSLQLTDEPTGFQPVMV